MTETVKLDPQWAGRRRIIIVSLVFCACLMTYAVSKDAAMANAVVPPMAFLGGSIIGSYVFGATWEKVSGVPSGNAVVTTTTPTTVTTTTETRPPGGITPAGGSP